MRETFAGECSVDSRFLKPILRTKMMNFAAENVKSSQITKDVNAAEGV